MKFSDIIGLAGLGLSFVGICITIVLACIGKKVLTEKKVEHNQKLREEFRKIPVEAGNAKYIQLRNSRMANKPKNIFLNKFSRVKGYSTKKAILSKIYSNGIWVSFSFATSDEMVKINGEKEDLYAFIPFDWIEVVDKENSDFVSEETTIIYVKSPWFKWPYQHRYPLDVDDKQLSDDDWKRISKKEEELRKKYRYNNKDDLFE